MDELKKCLCGSEVEIYQKGQNTLVIHCLGCGIKRTQKSLHYPIELIRTKMIEKWNTRPLEDDLTAKLEKARQALIILRNYNPIHNDLESYLYAVTDWGLGEIDNEPSPERYGL